MEELSDYDFVTQQLYRIAIAEGGGRIGRRALRIAEGRIAMYAPRRGADAIVTSATPPLDRGWGER